MQYILLKKYQNYKEPLGNVCHSQINIFMTKNFMPKTESKCLNDLKYLSEIFWKYVLNSTAT